jgi:hypothetical protein
VCCILDSCDFNAILVYRHMKITNSGSEVFGMHASERLASFLCGEDAGSLSNGLGGFQVVSTDQPNGDLCVNTGVTDGTGNDISEWVSEAKSGEICQTKLARSKRILQSFLGGSSLILVLAIPGVNIHLSIGKSEHTEWSGSHGVNSCGLFISIFCAKHADCSCGSDDMCTESKDNLWCTLDVNNDLVWVAGALKGYDRPLGFWGEWAGASNSTELSLDEKMDRDSGVLEESEKSNLSAATNRHVGGGIHLDSGLGVVEDAVVDAL